MGNSICCEIETFDTLKQSIPNIGLLKF